MWGSHSRTRTRKVVYDVSPTQQVSVTALGGRSALETVDEPLVAPARRWNRSRGPAHHRLAVHTRLADCRASASVRHRPGTRDHAAPPANSLAAATTGRSDIEATWFTRLFGGLLEAGAELSRMSGARDTGASGPAVLPDAFRATWATHAAYVNFARAASLEVCRSKVEYG